MPRNKPVRLERAPLEFHVSGSKGELESGRFVAVASAWRSIVDSLPHRTKFQRGAFSKTIQERGHRVKILSQHDQSKIWIGLPTKMEETDEGLVVHASLNQTQAAKDTMLAIRHAVSIGRANSVEFSIGFDSLDDILVEDEELGGETIRLIRQARLWELSSVNFAADANATLIEAASAKHLHDWPLKSRAEMVRELEEAERRFAAHHEPAGELGIEGFDFGCRR